MFEVQKSFCFEAAHRLCNHPGQCRNLHGHSYRVEIIIASLTLNGDGMVIDFGSLSKRIKTVIDDLDHATILHSEDPLVSILRSDGIRVVTIESAPTAEFLAQYIGQSVVFETELMVSKVVVWETEKCCAMWKPCID